MGALPRVPRRGGEGGRRPSASSPRPPPSARPRCARKAMIFVFNAAAPAAARGAPQKFSRISCATAASAKQAVGLLVRRSLFEK